MNKLLGDIYQAAIPTQHHMSEETSCTQQINEIQNLLNSPESNNVINSVRNEDIVIFIGNTKSGKSTLVNFVIGNELRAVKKRVIASSLAIMKVNEEDDGPIIGLEAVSETTLPTVWSAKKSGIKEKVVDAPGFEDNRGETQDIANAFYVKEILSNAKSVKVVLVTDINDILNDNIHSFTSFIEKINKIFQKIDKLYGSILLVFSKGSNIITIDDITNLFNESILNQVRIHLSNRSLIQYFVDHKEHIAFFNKPVCEGIIESDCLTNDIIHFIEDEITGVPGSVLADIRPGISDKSQILLLQFHNEFSSVAEYLQLLEKLKEAITRKSRSIYEIESLDEISKMDVALKEMEKKVSLLAVEKEDLSLSQLLEQVKELHSACGLGEWEDEGNIGLKLQFVEFVDELIGFANCGIYKEKFRGTLEMIQHELQVAGLLTATKMNKMTAEEAEKEKLLLKIKHDEEMKKYAEKIHAIEKENERKSREQLNNMGITDHLAAAGKKILSGIATWFSF